MASRPNKKSNPSQPEPVLVVAGMVSLLGVVAIAAIIWFSAKLAGVSHGSLRGWITASGGGPRWDGTATILAVLFSVALLAILTPLVFGIAHGLRGREWTDALASSMSGRRDEAEMVTKAATADATRLGSTAAGIGLVLGQSVRSQEWLYGLYEWSQIWIMGTRAGKSRSVAIPQIMGHGGALVTTSNKRDVHDRTRGPRSRKGKCWVNDPQQIAQEPASWWWNPLSFVTSVARAEELVELWAAARTKQDMAGADPYFEPEGRNLLANLLMAAAVGDEVLTRLPDWLTGMRPRPGIPDPVQILTDHGYPVLATDLATTLEVTSEQRDGLYGTARSFLRFLRSPEYVQWMAPTGPDDVRPQFDPDAFVRGTDTLYLLSKDGVGSARALTAALTVAVYRAGEEYAERCGDRVPTPILFLLDEAANVCRWPELPNLYSHAGGKGILLVTILQSYAQGESVWGADGMRMMWSAANIAAAGRGIRDDQHLQALARLVGDRQVLDRSRTVGPGHRSTSDHNREERIFSEADLAAMPRGRAVLLASGARPILLKTVDYSTYEWAYLVEASREAFRGAGSAEDQEAA